MRVDKYLEVPTPEEFKVAEPKEYRTLIERSVETEGNINPLDNFTIKIKTSLKECCYDIMT